MDDHYFSIYNVYEYTEVLGEKCHKLHSITTEMLHIDESKQLEQIYKAKLDTVYLEIVSKCSLLKEAVEFHQIDPSNTQLKDKVLKFVIEFNEFVATHDIKFIIDKCSAIIDLYDRKKREFLSEVINPRNNIQPRNNNIEMVNNIEGDGFSVRSDNSGFCMLTDSEDDEEEVDGGAEVVADAEANNIQPLGKVKPALKPKSEKLKDFMQDYPEQCKLITRGLFGLKTISKHVLKINYAEGVGKYIHEQEFKTIRGSRAFILTFEFRDDTNSYINSDFCKRMKALFSTYLICLETNGIRITIGGYLGNNAYLNMIRSDEFLERYGITLLDVMGYIFISDVYKILENHITYMSLNSEEIQRIKQENGKVETMREIYFKNKK
jgi:hypothetical protein